MGVASQNGPEPHVRGPLGRSSDLRSTLVILAHGWKSIVATLVVVLCLTVAYLATTEPVFEAHSLVMIEPDQSSVAAGLGSGVEESLGLRSTRLDNEVWFIRNSLGLAERVAGSLVSERASPPFESGTATDSVDLDREPLTALYDEEGSLMPTTQIALGLLSRIEVKPDGQATGWEPVDGIRILARSSRPAEAALIANSFAAEYVARSQESSRASIVGSKSFLEAQEQKLRDNLASIEDDLEEYLSEEGAVALDEEASQTVAQIAQIEADRDEARIEIEMHEATLLSLERELAQVEPSLVRRLASGVDQELERTQEQLVELELRAEQIYLQTPELRENPEANQQLADLERRIRELRVVTARLSEQYVEEVLASGGIDAASNRTSSTRNSGLVYVSELRRRIAEEQITLSGLEAKQSVLSQRITQYEEKLISIPKQSLRIAEMRRAQEATERLYIFIVEKLQEARMLEESELGYADVVMPAFEPTTPVHPRNARTLVLAFLFGLMLGGGFVLLRQRFDTRIHHPDEIRARGLAVVGVVPETKQVGDSSGGPNHREADGEVPSLIMFSNPMSPGAEAYRKLRTNVEFAEPDSETRVIVVTSPGPGEGKSTTAANLAICLAQSGKKTALVDADMRRPIQHRLFLSDRAPGLSDLILTKKPLQPSDFSTDFDDMYFIPAGSGTYNPAELLASRKAGLLWDQLGDAFDVVIVDTPPAIGFSDAALVSAKAAGTLVVATAQETDLDALEEAAFSVVSVGGTLIGAVLNRFNARQASAYGYDARSTYGYNYSSYYTSDGHAPRQSRSLGLGLGVDSRHRDEAPNSRIEA